MTQTNPKVETPAAAQEDVTTFSQSDGLVRHLAGQRASLMFSSYQSGLLYMLGYTAAGGAHLHQSAMDKPMGIWVEDENAFTLSAGYQIMRFKNGLEPEQRVNVQFDACYVARETHFTGELDAHDIGIGRDGQPIFVNTRYNCLATTDPRHSFREVWRPPFISALVDEDRCHLNGLAMDNGEPAYVTAVSRSDTIDGWRDRRHDGGVIMDQGRIMAAGCVFPVSQKEVRDRAIGLRHRAGMGVTEETDAIALIVSEESGALSIAFRGKLEHDLEPEELRNRLNELLTFGTPKKETTQEDATRELGTP